MSFFFCGSTTARKLNRKRTKRKRWGRGRGEKAVRKTSPHPLPHRFLFLPPFSIRAALTLYFENHKRTRTHTKNNNNNNTASYASYVHRKIRFKIRSFSFEGAVAHLPVFVRAKSDPNVWCIPVQRAELSITAPFFEINPG